MSAADKNRLVEWEQEVSAALTPSAGWDGPPWNVHCFREIASTMEAAREELNQVTAIKPLLVMTERQTMGRGRQGRRWESSPQGFYGTFGFLATKPVSALVGLSLVVGSVLAEVFESLSCSVGLKWPNDVLDRHGRKISGILIELAPVTSGTVVLIGIGINLVGQPEQLKQESSSLLGLSGRAVRPPGMATRVAPALWEAWKKFEAQGFKAFRQRWTEQAMFIDSELTVDLGNKEILRGTFRGVNEQGCMCLEVGGQLREIAAGHILER